MNDNPYPDSVLIILKETFLKVRPLPLECLLEHEKIRVAPGSIKLDSFVEQESQGENLNEHIKVTFQISEGYTTWSWYVNKEDCRIEPFLAYYIKNQKDIEQRFGYRCGSASDSSQTVVAYNTITDSPTPTPKPTPRPQR